MARLGREGDGILSFPSTAAKPAFSKSKSKSKKKKSKTSTKHCAVEEQTNLPRPKAELSDNAQVSGNVKKRKLMPKTVLLPSAGGNLGGGKDKENDSKLNLDADSFPSTDSDDDAYSPLLRFICEHSFMRAKRYPVSLSLRQQFVHDVHKEAVELGYEEKEVDRVLLDIKRYYLKSVGFGAAFSEGVEFGVEVNDSSPASHGFEVPGSSEQKTTSKHKREEALTRADSLVEKRLVNITSLSGRTALTSRDAFDHNHLDEKGKLSKFQRKRKRKRERRQEPGEPLSEAHKGASQNPTSIDFEHPKVAIPNKAENLPGSGKRKTQNYPPSRPQKEKKCADGLRASQPLSKISDSRQGGAIHEGPIVLDF
ncbi:hypothetical protein BDW75DRAFT_245140 [Aspergillus navahoensis]